MNMATLKIFSGCRYIASPFISLEDLSWRLLLRKFGVHLCFTNLTRAQDCIENADSLFGSLPRLEDRPLIVQLFSEDADSLVAAVSGLKDLCDAVDIIDCSNSSCTEDDRWNAWLSCIQKVQQECKMPILCKLPFSQKTVDDTIRKGNSLQEAGCKLLLLHKHRTGTVNSIVTKKDWDSIKTICKSVSLPFILDVGSSSLWDIDKCLEYTGVQGVAVSDSLEANPTLFCKKQPAVLDVVNQYLELCGAHPTPIANIKQHLSGFLGY